MKKRISFLFFVIFSFPLFADLNAPVRSIEFGFDVCGGVSNSYLTVSQVLKEEIIVDLEEIATGIGDGGLVFDFASNFNTFFKIQGKKHRFHFFLDLDASGYANIPHEVFDILGKGVMVGDNKSFSFQAYADAFMSLGFSYFRRSRDSAITITPTYYIPLLYVSDITANAHYSLSSSGKINAKAEADINLYSAINAEKIIDKTVDANDIKEELSEIVSNGGFDLGLSYERKIVRSFDASVYTRIPIVPGKLKYKAHTKIWAQAYETNALGLINETEDHDYDYGKDEFDYSETNFKVFRPFRLGVEGIWRPFGDWSYFKPSIGFAVRNPYIGPAIVYPEGGLVCDFRFFKIFGINFSTLYMNRVFSHRLGLFINMYFCEIDAFAGFRSGDFSTSFEASGVTAGITLKFGI